MNKSTGFRLSLAAVLLSLLMSSGVCFAGPGLLNYQGRLTDAKGNPVTYTVTITFTFWSAESAGEMLGGFSDSDTVTPDRDGIYSTLIGDDPGNLIPGSVFERKAVWLNVNVNGEDLRPRKRLTSVGYSVQSETVQGAEVGRMSFKAAEDIKEGDVVVLTENGEIVPTRLPGIGEAFELAPGSAPVYPIDATQVSAGKVLLFYRAGIGGGTRAVVANVSDMNVTADRTKELVLSNGYFDEPAHAEKLEENKAVITYKDSQERKAVVVSVGPDGSIALGGSPATIASGTAGSGSVALDSNRLLVAYTDDTQVKAVIATINGNNISVATPVRIRTRPWSVGCYHCVKLDTDKVAISYGSMGQFECMIATANNTSISTGTVLSELVPDFLRGYELAPLAPNKAVWGYIGSQSLNACAVCADGTTLSRSDFALVASHTNTYVSGPLVHLRENVCLAVHDAKVYPILGSGNSIVCGTPVLYTDASRFQTDFACAGISTTRILIAYTEATAFGGSALGTFLKVIDVDQSGGERDYGNRIGVAESAAQAGEECLVTIPGGVTKQFSGLIPGKDYFVTEKGISDKGVLRIGIALTPDKLLISR